MSGATFISHFLQVPFSFIPHSPTKRLSPPPLAPRSMALWPSFIVVLCSQIIVSHVLDPPSSMLQPPPFEARCHCQIGHSSETDLIAFSVFSFSHSQVVNKVSSLSTEGMSRLFLCSILQRLALFCFVSPWFCLLRI